MKKFIVITLCVLMLLAVGCKKEETPTVDIVEFPVETPAQPGQTVQVSMTAAGGGMTAAGAVHSLGVRTDGTVIAAGHNTQGQNAVGDWQNVVYAAAGDALSIGATATGAVLLAGNTANGESDALSWTNIQAVAAGSAHVAGLKTDGTVVAAGSNANGQCDVSAWTDVVAIAAAGNHTVGLKADGTVLATGDVQTPDWSGIIAIDTNASSIVGVKQDGVPVTTGAQVLTGWSGLGGIAAGDTILVGVKKDGTILTDATDDVSAITTAVSASAGKGHALVMLRDGTVVGLGDNSDFQINVGAWKLRPYADSGCLVGFAPGMTVERVVSILNDVNDTDTAVIKKAAEAGVLDREDMVPTDIICTGAEAFVNDASLGPIVVRGDVNGDGQVTAEDAEMINNFILGNISLDGYKRVAASIYTSVSGEVMTASVDAVNAYISDKTPIPQFGGTLGGHTYDQKIAEAKAVNEDVTGWITIPGTNMDFPIMKATKDYHYNDYTWDNKKDKIGSVYMYYNEARQGQFYAFTAHNNRKRAADSPGDPTSMFHQLHHVYDYNIGLKNCAYEKCGAALTSELPDLRTYAGRVWTINVLGEEGLWEIYSAYLTDETTEKTNLDTLYDNIWFFKGEMGWSSKLDTLYTERTLSKEDIQKWLDDHQTKNKLDLGGKVEVGINDKLMTIATCGTNSSSAGERLFFFLHKVG